MAKKYVEQILETVKNEGNITITFITTCGLKIKISQKESSAATCMYNNGYSVSRYYTINKNNMLVVYQTEDGDIITQPDNILYENIICYTVEYL